MKNKIKSVKSFVLDHYPDANIKRINSDKNHPKGKFIWYIEVPSHPTMITRGISYISAFDSWFQTACDIKMRNDKYTKFKIK